MNQLDDSGKRAKRRGPRHVAIIMDGNGRWATERGLPRAMGHRAGVEAVRGIVKAALEERIDTLTLYSFSAENWRRPQAEIDYLFSLLERFIRHDTARLHEQGVRIRIIGERDGLRPDILRMIDECQALTRDNERMTLVVAFNYGGRQEIAAAARALAGQVAAGRLKPEDITPERLQAHLFAPDLPPLDLLIRTGGEQRLSNFLLWQAAYAELVFMPQYWPDFDAACLRRALAEFRGRTRRFGGLVDVAAAE